MTQVSDTPSSPSTAMRWTFYRRLGLLLRTQLDTEGTTLSLHEIAARTRGRLSAGELGALLAQGPLAQPDPITCILLAQAFDVDPDFFITDAAIHDYIRAIRAASRRLGLDSTASLQMHAYVTATRAAEREAVATR